MTRILFTLIASILLAFATTVYAINLEPFESITTTITQEVEKTTETAENKPDKEAEVVVDPQGCEPEQFWAKEPPHDCIDKTSPAEIPLTTQSTGSEIKDSIIKWANHYGLSPERMLRVANCESTFNPSAQNKNYYAGGGHPTGLFQYLPETWNRIGSRSPYGVGDIWDYEQQAKVTAWAFANGYSGEWACR